MEGRPVRTSATFPSASSGSTLPPPRSLVRRLAYLAFAALNRLVPKRGIVLHSTIDLEDGVLAILEELAARDRTATVLLEDPSRAPALRAIAPGNLTTVPKRSLRGVWHFLTASHVFTTETVFGDRPPPPSQVLVNIWHGELTKPVGRYLGLGPVQATYAPVCSTVTRAYRSAEFGVPPLQVPVVGAPRNDRLLRADGSAIREGFLGAEAELPTLLWLPTLRRGRWGSRERLDVVGEPYPGVPFPPEQMHDLDDWLVRRGARLVVKLHPHDVAVFPGTYRAIRLLGQRDMEQRGLTVYPLLAAFDGLVTDVSSAWVDYLLLDKPLIFAFPDIEEYRQGRGLAMEPYEHWVPGSFVRTLAEFIEALDAVAAGADPLAGERRLARLRWHQYHDDASAARLLDGLGLGRREP